MDPAFAHLTVVGSIGFGVDDCRRKRRTSFVLDNHRTVADNPGVDEPLRRNPQQARTWPVLISRQAVIYGE